MTGEVITQDNGKSKNGISGSTVKMIAIVTMLVDHTAAVVLERIIADCSYGTADELLGILKVLYFVMRLIGRLGFPLFIFLLVEGYCHTRSRWKYLTRMFLFALFSEIPFDIAFNLNSQQVFSGHIFEFSYQNVFFTLSIGLLTIIVINIVDKAKLNIYETRQRDIVKAQIKVIVIAFGMGLAFILKTDYSYVGVLAIAVMYMSRRNKIRASVATCTVLLFSSVSEVTAYLTILPIANYNGKRGWNVKWIFYLFYPLHLFLLWYVCILLKIA